MFLFYSISDEIFPHQDRQVRDYVIHPEYRRGSQFNDIALLFLAEPVTIAENVNVACLPQQGDVFDGVSCFASGWGKDQFGANGRYQVLWKTVWRINAIKDVLIRIIMPDCRLFWNVSNCQLYRVTIASINFEVLALVNTFSCTTVSFARVMWLISNWKLQKSNDVFLMLQVDSWAETLAKVRIINDHM